MLFILIEYTLTWPYQCDWTRQMCPTKIASTVSHTLPNGRREAKWQQQQQKYGWAAWMINELRGQCASSSWTSKNLGHENADQNTVRTRLGTRRNIHEIQRNRQFGICDECVVRDAVMRNCNADDRLWRTTIMKSNVLHVCITWSNCWFRMRSGLFTSHENIGSRSHSALALFFMRAYKTHHHNRMCHLSYFKHNSVY